MDVAHAYLDTWTSAGEESARTLVERAAARERFFAANLKLIMVETEIELVWYTIIY